MKVTLIDYTQFAENKLIYTKATRLTQGLELRKEIDRMTSEEKRKELAYIARTVPSSWEFVTYTFEILGVTRAFTHQLVRTRTGSYAQQTMRTLPMGKFTYETGPSIEGNLGLRVAYDNAMYMIQQAYDWLITNGAKVEDARGLLPTNIHTNIIAQFNLRSLSDLVRKRWTARTQNEYYQVVMAMVDAVVDVHPWAKDFLLSDKVKAAKELEDLVNQAMVIGDADSKLKALKLIDLLRKD